MRRVVVVSVLIALALVLGTPSVLGVVNKVLSLDGDGDYVEIVDSPILNNLDTQITIEVWIRCDRLESGFSSIIYKGDEHEPDWSHRSFALWFHSSGTIHFTSAPSDSGQYALDSPGNSIHFYTWYHVVGIIDAVNQEMKILINGNEVAIGNYGNSIRNSLLPLRIGVGDCCATFAGYIDEVRIWNTVRTQQQIQDNMNQPIQDPKSLEHLVGYWNFDDGTANDLSRYGNNGGLKGNAHIADVIYVSTEGSDTGGDGTYDNPYRTIQKGINESGRNDIIQVLPGTYEENISLLSDLTVLGFGVENTIITASSGNIVTAHNVHNVSLSGFTIDGQGSADSGVVYSGTTSEVEIHHNIVTSAKTGIKCLNAANVNLRYNAIKHNTVDGIECSDSTNVTIDDNNVEDNGRHGVACNGDAEVKMVNNDIRRNSRNGICSWNAANITIQYNVISRNDGEGSVCTDSNTVTYMSNTLQYNYQGMWCDGKAVANIIDNLIHSNKHRGIVLAGSSNTTIIRNTIRDHHGAIDCHHSVNVLLGGKLTDANNIIDNRGVAIVNFSSSTINATYNYWGTTNENEIAAMMRNEGGGSIIFKPFINSLDEIIADTSGDGTISAYDAALLLQYLVGLIDQFPATSPVGQAAQKYISGEITIADLDGILQRWGYPSVFKLLGYDNQLLQNYPNPFNPETWIPFKLAQDAPVTISIYDTTGQLIRTIALGKRNAGIYTIQDQAAYWDGRDSLGQPVTSGVYYYTLQAGEFRATRKMVILK